MTKQAFGHIGWRQAQAPIAEPPPRGLRGPQATAAPLEEASAFDDALVSRLVYSVVALYAVTFTLLSILQHEAFQTHAFDLGNMDQAVWNTAQGRPLEFTNWTGGTNRLAAHVEPVLFLVALAYKLYSSPATLLVLQSVTMALGALPAYWLARRVLGNGLAGAAFAFSYLLAPALQIANLADFHAVSVSAAFLLFAFYYAWCGGESRRARMSLRGAEGIGVARGGDEAIWGLFFLFAVLAMATKEQVPLTVFGMGLYVALVQRRPRIGYAACALAAAWAAIAFLVIIPHFNAGGASPYVSRYQQLALDSVTEAARLEFVQLLLQPAAYLALLSPLTLAMGLPELAINLLSSFPEMYWGQAHYGAALVPVVTVSAILGAGFLYRAVSPLHPRAGQAARWVIAGSVLVSSLASFYTQVFLPLADHPFSATAHHQRVREVLALIPPDAVVSAGSTLNPHLSQRRGLHLFPDLGDADYVVVDATATPYPIDTANQWYRLQQMLESKQWGVLAGRDGVLLLQRLPGLREPFESLRTAPQATSPPEEFYTFTQAEDVKTRVDREFTPGLVLAGYALEPGSRVHGRQGYATLDLFWRVSSAPASDFLVAVSLVGPAGETIFIDRHQATTLWRPPARWEDGSFVRVTVPRLPLNGTTRGEVRVALVEREAPYLPLSETVVLTEIVRG